MISSKYKKDFPIFEYHPDLVYLDNAATTQRVGIVVDRMRAFDEQENANVHRGIYDLSNKASERVDGVRRSIADWLGSSSEKNIAFTKGTTEGINIVSNSFLRKRLTKGDNVVTTVMEHHANFLPWQQLCAQVGAELRIAGIDEEGNLDMSGLLGSIDGRTKMVAVTHISNTLGTVNDIQWITYKARERDVPILIDAAQSMVLHKPDLSSFDCDFLVFSAHKMFGPFGVGALYVNDRQVDQMDSYNFGGGIVEEVGLDETSYQKFPYNLDAGTPNVSGIIGFGEAISYLSSIKEETKTQVGDLVEMAREQLSSIQGVDLIGKPKVNAEIVSFNIEGVHPHDVSSFLDKDGIAVRAGMHCTQPLFNRLGLNGSVRASFSIYNTKEDVDKLVDSVKDLRSFWS